VELKRNALDIPNGAEEEEGVKDGGREGSERRVVSYFRGRQKKLKSKLLGRP